jgi:hypothetical protein
MPLSQMTQDNKSFQNAQPCAHYSFSHVSRGSVSHTLLHSDDWLNRVRRAILAVCEAYFVLVQLANFWYVKDIYTSFHIQDKPKLCHVAS